jgi:hypothetical protein
MIYFDNLHLYSNHIQGDVAFSCMGTTHRLTGSKEAKWEVYFDYQYQFARLASNNETPVLVLLSALNADEIGTHKQRIYPHEQNKHPQSQRHRKSFKTLTKKSHGSCKFVTVL